MTTMRFEMLVLKGIRLKSFPDRVRMPALKRLVIPPGGSLTACTRIW